MALRSLLEQELIGQYGYNPANSCWHGGVHFTLNNAPHCQKDYPVVAIADGKIVACRLSSDYLVSEFKGVELPYSGDFCLVEHVYQGKDEAGEDQRFTFYSLYMHLAPLAEENTVTYKDSFTLPDWLYTRIVVKITDSEGLKGRADPVDGKAGSKICGIPKNSVLVYNTGEMQQQMIGARSYKMAPCTLQIPIIVQGSSITKAWVCIEERFVERVAANTLNMDCQSTFAAADQISVKAGDAIGYLGKYHVPDKIEAETPDVDARYQVHFELLSKDEPPTWFLKDFFSIKDDETLSKVIGGDSDGYLDDDEPNDFFKAFYEAITLDRGDVPGTEVFYKDIIEGLTPWESAKKVYAQHTSEWYHLAADKPFLETLISKYTSPDFAQLIEHEKERIDNLVWMQESSSLGFGEQVWNWWPIGDGPECSEARTKITKEMLRKIWTVSIVSDDLLQAVADEVNEISIITKLNSKLRLDHFFAQILQEIGVRFRLEENFIYQKDSLLRFSYYSRSESYKAEADDDAFPASGASRNDRSRETS